jgi:hypothetical protein
MGKRIWTFLCILILLTFSLSGCYYYSATKEMKAAEQLISQLKAAGGVTLVPYEYTSAEKFLEVSRIVLVISSTAPATSVVCDDCS